MTDETVQGIAVIDKHPGVTSADIVFRLRRLYGTRQIGHTGTLDPMASGVLPVLVGRAVKASEFIMAEDKRYTATLRLGIRTDTEDTTGKVLSVSEVIPEEAEVRRVCASFVGEILQTPPMYSALKVGGKKLVDLAREGIEIEREARPITVRSLTVERIDRESYTLDVRCTKGTYIRTLCADIGNALGCGGAMASLRRTESGVFSLSDAVTAAQLEEMTPEERKARLIPTERFFSSAPAVHLPAFYARLARNGCEIYQSKIKTDYPAGTLVRLYREAEFFALGEVRPYPDGSAIKAVKILSL